MSAAYKSIINSRKILVAFKSAVGRIYNVEVSILAHPTVDLKVEVGVDQPD